MILKGKIVDPYKRRIFNGIISTQEGVISKIEEIDQEQSDYIIPGFIDAHVHIESSMLVPSEFAAAAIRHGTVGVIADPHEIANVCGEQGIDFMIENGNSVPLKILFGLPSCVPATSLESSGAVISEKDTFRILKKGKVAFLAEMMNFPGVLAGDGSVMGKLEAARKLGLLIDGHAPGVTGEDLKKYISTGISTDHEAVSVEEALEKIARGMKILIREGSAARNLKALHSLVATHTNEVMLCSDDIHPERLVEGHINLLVRWLLAEGHNIFDVLMASTVNPVKHYGIDVGLLQVGESADFQIVNNLTEVKVKEVYIRGEKAFGENSIKFDKPSIVALNNFNCSKINHTALKIIADGRRLRVIRAFDGELNTKSEYVSVEEGREIKADVKNDILKIVVKERYMNNPPVAAFIKGFGLKSGAFAGSVAHDSHNIIAVGCDDRSLAEAINMVVDMKGGLAIYDAGKKLVLQLPVGGIMSDVPCGTIATKYQRMSDYVKELGSELKAPFMTLSFMSLLVIPELKLGDRGLFELSSFSFVDLFS